MEQKNHHYFIHVIRLKFFQDISLFCVFLKLTEGEIHQLSPKLKCVQASVVWWWNCSKYYHTKYLLVKYKRCTKQSQSVFVQASVAVLMSNTIIKVNENTRNSAKISFIVTVHRHINKEVR